MASTACWRGYVCKYVVVCERMQLDQLEAKLGRDEDELLRLVEPPVLHGRPGIAADDKGAGPDLRWVVNSFVGQL